MNTRKRARLLASSGLISAAILASWSAPTWAQSSDAPLQPTAEPGALQAEVQGPAPLAPPVPTGPATNVQEVVVTGSRIRSPGLTSTSPLTVVGSQDIKGIGATSVDAVLNELPSIVVDQTSTTSPSLGTGIATVDLRDLGAKRTLVLVDGRRLMPGDPQNPVANLNDIPTALVDRVEVVTGGASAVYGSDAVAGVVNFIMKKNFQGVEVQATDNFAEHNNDDSAARQLVSNAGFAQAPSGAQALQVGASVSVIAGINAPDDRGNVTAYATYRNLQPILNSKYDFAACTISAAPGKSSVPTIYAGHACGGSSNSVYGKFVPTVASEALGGATAQFHDNPDGSGSFVSNDVPSYNYGATNYLQRSDIRYTGGYFGHYQLTKKLDLYSDFMFADDKTVGQLAPSGLFAGSGANGASTFNINCNNPLMTAAQQSLLCGSAAGTSTQVPYQIGYRFGSFPRDYQFEHLDYKIDLGARGQLDDVWTYDAYIQYGTSISSNLLRNEASLTRIQNALLVDPTTGKCLSGGACVPLDIFKANGVTSAAFDYVSVPALQTGQTTEQVASASFSGDLGHYGVRSPYADHGLGVALGAEYRREALSFTPDIEYTTGDLAGSPAAYANQGSFDVAEVFGEARIPLVQGGPFVRDLSFDGGYRFSDYSTAGVTQAYKAQFEYAPNADIRFRGGYNRSVRAPNVVELYTAKTVNDFGGSDPCVGATPAASKSACVATGLPAALYGKFSSDNDCPAGECSVLNGGNLALKPETSDTFTGGFVLTPTWSWTRGFSLSVDYFNITVRDLITEISPTIFASECAAGDLAICSATFHRDPSTYVIYGSQGYITSEETNSGFLRTDGIDLEANYRKQLSDLGLPDLGVLSFNWVGTYTNKYKDQPVSGGLTYDCAGLYGTTCGTPLPKIKGKLRMTYVPSMAPVSVSLAWRYVGPVHLDANTDQQLLTSHPYGITDTADNSIHPFSYFDLSVAWQVRQNLSLNVGVNNIFDKNPPVVDSGPFAGDGQTAGSSNTYPGVYDYLGRTMFVTLTADFK